MELCVSFPSQTPLDRSLILGELYRQSLIEVGYSADAHIYDLDYLFIAHKRATAATRYLFDAHSFYLSLPDFERSIYVCQVLEYGRHFRFWWLMFTPDKNKYLRAYSNVLRKMERVFR